MIAQIVPILRLRRNTNWWSYKIKVNQKCSTGSLVVIDFRGKASLGVVWKIENETKNIAEYKDYKEVLNVITHNSLLTINHLRFIEWLAQNGLCSLSTALYTWLPTSLRKYPLSPKTNSLLSSFDKLEPKKTLQNALILPSKREEQTSILNSNRQYFNAFKEQTALEELSSWIKIRIGEITTISGRERAIFAPWNNLQKLLIVDPEDINYFHEQTPYLSLIQASNELIKIHNAQILLKSYLPSEATNRIWNIPNQIKLEAQNITATKVEVASLINQKIINPTLIREVLETLNKNKTVCLISSSYNSFNIIPTQSAPPFGELNIIDKVPGVDTLTKNLLRELKLQYKPNNLYIGTQSILQNIPENVALTIFISFDPLLSSPIFANKLSSYASLLKAVQKSKKVILQTFNPSHSIFEALINNSITKYILEVVQQQESLNLPPFGVNLVCSYPVENKIENETQNEEVEKIRQKISKILEPSWQVSYPIKTSVRKKELLSLIIHCQDNERIPSNLKDLLTILPKPWKVQNNPWYLV